MKHLSYTDKRKMSLDYKAKINSKNSKAFYKGKEKVLDRERNRDLKIDLMIKRMCGE